MGSIRNLNSDEISTVAQGTLQAASHAAISACLVNILKKVRMHIRKYGKMHEFFLSGQLNTIYIHKLMPLVALIP